MAARLVYELRRGLWDRPVLVLAGRCSSYASGVPYLPVLYMLRNRARGHRSDMPISDGSAIAAVGFIAAILILIRIFDRPVGQGLLALACAGIVAFAGIREHTKRTAGDQPAAPAEARPNPLEGFEEAVEEATAPEPPARAERLRG